MRNRQAGFGTIEVIIATFVVLFIGASGYYITHANTSKPPVRGDKAAQASFEVEADIKHISNYLENIQLVRKSYPSDINGATFNAAGEPISSVDLTPPSGVTYKYDASPSGCTTAAKNCTSFVLTAVRKADNKVLKTIKANASVATKSPEPTPAPTSTPAPQPTVRAINLTLNYLKVSVDVTNSKYTDIVAVFDAKAGYYNIYSKDLFGRLNKANGKAADAIACNNTVIVDTLEPNDYLIDQSVGKANGKPVFAGFTGPCDPSQDPALSQEMITFRDYIVAKVKATLK